MVFLVGQEDEEPKDVRNQEVDVVQVRLLDALQLLRDEVDEHLNAGKIRVARLIRQSSLGSILILINSS